MNACRNQRPSLTFSVIKKIFVLAALGTTVHLNVYYACLACTSLTVASALNNVSPRLTFLMALLVRYVYNILNSSASGFFQEPPPPLLTSLSQSIYTFDLTLTNINCFTWWLLGWKVKITSVRSQTKVVGTLVCLCGSLVFTLWKGGYVFKGFALERPLINIYDPKGSVSEFKHANQNWIKGSALILTSHIAWSAWLILHVIFLTLHSFFQLSELTNIYLPLI